jgi:Tol biopolymer transport system component
VWSPNADQVVYQNGVGGGQLLLRASNGAGDERLLTKVDGTAIPQGWTKVGNHILFEFHAAGSSAGEIWLIRATPNAGPPRPLVKGVVTFGAAVSPDGKWLAYTSDESGRAEIYVIPLIANKDGEIMPSSSRWQISTDGGTQPRWGPRGDELFFVNPSQTALYSTTIKISGGDQLESGGIRKLFDLAIHPAWCFYDISPNGQIYMLRYVGRQSSPLTILVGWSQQDQSK